MKRLIALIAIPAILLSLSACSNMAHPGIEVREIGVPVPVPCIAQAAIPAAPAFIRDDLTGDARTDVSLISESALSLRRWGEMMAALLISCASPPSASP